MSRFSIVNEILHMVDFFLYDVIFPVLHYFFCYAAKWFFSIPIMCVK